MPELLDELSIARSGGTLKKVLESYKKKDLLILDEWLIRPLSPQESYDCGGAVPQVYDFLHAVRI